MLRAVNASYDDPVGDAQGGGVGADIRSAGVVSDSSGFAVGVFYANRTCATSGDQVYVSLDVDQNPATGDVTTPAGNWLTVQAA